MKKKIKKTRKGEPFTNEKHDFLLMTRMPKFMHELILEIAGRRNVSVFVREAVRDKINRHLLSKGLDPIFKLVRDKRRRPGGYETSF